MPLLGNVLSEKEKQFAGFTRADRSYIRDTGAFPFDNISAEDVKLFLLKQTYKSLPFLSDTMDIISNVFLSGWQCPASPAVNPSLFKPNVTKLCM